MIERKLWARKNAQGCSQRSGRERSLRSDQQNCGGVPGATILVNILKDSFAKVTKDPELQAEAQKLKMEVEYTSGEEIMKVIQEVLNQPEDIVKEFAKYVKF
jgi:hypothetical protein